MSSVIEGIRDNPIVAAIRRSEDAQEAIDSKVTTVFILNSDIFNVKELVAKIKSSGKNVLVHIDFVEGLGKDQRALDFIAQYAQPDGIISTRTPQIKKARESGIFAIQRFFLIDSLSFHTTLRSIQSLKPDMMEIMPAVMPDVIRRISRQTEVPVIAGGLIDTKKDIIDILSAGAMGASTGKKELWNL
jgi:glycerol uptake operon antiterminator